MVQLGLKDLTNLCSLRLQEMTLFNHKFTVMNLECIDLMLMMTVRLPNSRTGKISATPLYTNTKQLT